MEFMRLSLMKAAHAADAWYRVQEIRVKPHFGLSGITALDVRLPIRRASNERNSPEATAVTSMGRNGFRKGQRISLPCRRLLLRQWFTPF
jgi:hypothetical protein